MYNVTEKFKTYAAHPQRVTYSKVVIADVEYTDANIVDWDTEDSAIADNDLQLGSVVTSHLNLSLNTPTLIPSNAQIKPYIQFSVDGDLTEWCPMGVFYVDSRNYKNKLWRFSCFDRLLVTQQYFKSDLLYPNTMYQVVVEMSYNLGLNVSQATLDMLTALGYAIATKPNEEWSYRDVLSYIAIACGCNVRMNRLGEMEFFKHGSAVVRNITAAEITRPEEVAPNKLITQLICNYDSDQEPIIVGVGELDNALYVYSPYITEEIANTIFEEVNELTYDPIQTGWRCEAYLDIGDKVTVTTREKTYTTFILRHRTKYRGGLSSKIESPCSTVQQSEFQFGGSINNQIAEVGKRIGLFANTTNTSKKTIKQLAVQVALMPLTTASETDIEFVVTFNGVASVDSVLHVSFRIAGSDIGRVMRIPVKAGLVGNFISFSTLRAKVPKISDWLFLRMVIDSGQFVIEKEECEFYIYGGNIVSGDVKPILEFEDLVGSIEGLSDGLSVVFPTHVSIVASDSIGTVAGLSDNLGGVVIV